MAYVGEDYDQFPVLTGFVNIRADKGGIELVKAKLFRGLTVQGLQDGLAIRDVTAHGHVPSARPAVLEH